MANMGEVEVRAEDIVSRDSGLVSLDDQCSLPSRRGNIHNLAKCTRLEDCDATWLYGPLQTSSDKLSMPCSKSNSFLNKKPILKKRSVLEIKLQWSPSASSHLKAAAAAAQAQQGDASRPSQKADSPNKSRATLDYVTLLLSLRSVSRDNGSEFPSVSSLGEQSAVTNERRHIHFNDRVEQCIAVEVENGDVDDDENVGESYAGYDDDDSSSDDGLIMMKGSSKPNVPNRSGSRNSFPAESRSIAMLPFTLLKYREDALELTEQATKQDGGFWSPRISPSPSQEPLRPSQPSPKILLDNDDKDADMSWNPPSVFTNRKDIISVTRDIQQNLSSRMNRGEEHSDLRRTSSLDDVEAAGLFGRMVDVVNIAKDMAYVIWNVGWTR